MSTFDGFPQDALTFFHELVTNNERTWFDANKARFQASVQCPAQAFVEALGDRLQTIAPAIRYDTRLNGSGSIMRIYRDVRFSPDKSPYKTNMGIVWWQGEGKKTECPAFYFHLEAGSVWMGGGLYSFPDLERYRRAVDAERTGSQLEQIVAELAANGLPIQGDRYVRTPGEYGADHPRSELLKFKGLIVSSAGMPVEVVTSPKLVQACFEVCQQMLPLHRWLVQMMNG